jgi:hypothetical protein
VNYSPGFRWLLASLIPATLGLKLVTFADEPAPFADPVTTFLEERGFSIVSNEKIMINNDVIVAVRDQCRMLFAPVSDTLSGELLKTMVGQTDQIAFIFRGAVYDNIPNWITAADRIFSRIITRFGSHRPSLTLRIAASPQCEIRKIPWDQL